MEFFDDLSVPVKFLIAFVVALAMLGVVGYLMRRFSGPRGRQPRLAVINAASVDGRRRLVLVRRDNMEHLLLIGGPTDVVIESNIDRTGTVAPAPVPEPKASPPLPPPRQTLSLEGLGLPPGEPVYVEPPPPRPVREAAMLRPLPTPIERQRLETLNEEVGAPPLPTPLPDAGPAFYPQPSFELPAHVAPVPPSFEPVFQIPPAPEPKRMQDEKSNLSEMALRLEAALRRPIKPVEPASSAQSNRLTPQDV